MSLRFRLSLVFLFAIVLSTGVTLAYVSRSVENMFRSFVFTGDSDKARTYAVILQEYYREKETWSGVQGFLQGLPNLISLSIDSRIHGSYNDSSLSPLSLRALVADRVVLADAEGVIIADTAGLLNGSVHPGNHLAQGIPVAIGFTRVGTVLVGSMIHSSLTGIEEHFLLSFRDVLVWTTLLASIVSLCIVLYFSSQITRPLSILSAAARSVSLGRETEPIPVRGDDEIARLGLAFNEMTEGLSRLEEAKRQIIADAAHELRTPLTLIQGMIEGMLDGILPADTHTLESVHEETIRLSRLIHTLRELEMIESGTMKLVRESVDLPDECRKAVVFFSSAAEAKSIHLEFQETSPDPVVFSCDRFKLREVIFNLLSNAIAYVPEGGVIQLRTRQSEALNVYIEVEDSGPGIPDSERLKIFERFYRIDKSRSSHTGGRGLGLSIVSEIVRAHKGRVWVETPSGGKGSLFIVELPAIT